MDLTSVELHPSNSSNVVVLSFRDPTRANTYNIKGVSGLDSDEIIPKYYGTSGDTLNKFYTLSLEKREIVFLIELNPDFSEEETYSSLRDALYKMIASSRTGLIEIQFKNDDDVLAVTSGFISKFETAQFTKTPEVQLTIKPNDPLLRAPTPILVDLLVPVDDVITLTDDLSTAPHGFKMAVVFNSGLASFKCTDPNDGSWSFQITPAGGFLAGDILLFSSELNDKYIYLSRDDEIYALANFIIPGSFWPLLFPGNNAFLIENSSNLNITNFSYYPTYWGV